jgi:hypothetical protein
MAGPGDGEAASAVGRGHLRASHADREQVIGTLKAAFVQGMLDKDEFDLRVGQAFASRTYAELAAVTADIPARPSPAKPPQPARVEGEARVLRPGTVIKVATVLYAGAWSSALLLPLPKDGDGDRMGAILLVFGATLFYLFIMSLAVGYLIASRREKRSGGQAPRLPGHRRRAVEGEQSSRPGNDLILCQAPRDTRARRLLGHSVTQRIWRSVPTRRASAGLCT